MLRISVYSDTSPASLTSHILVSNARYQSAFSDESLPAPAIVTGRETDRQTDRQAGRQRERERERERERGRERERDEVALSQ